MFESGHPHHESIEQIRQDIEGAVDMERRSSNPNFFTKSELQEIAGFILDHQEGDDDE